MFRGGKDMVLRTQNNYELDTEIESSSEVTSQTTEAKTYVIDLLGELQTIAAVAGFENLSNDIKMVLMRHLP